MVEPLRPDARLVGPTRPHWNHENPFDGNDCRLLPVAGKYMCHGMPHPDGQHQTSAEHLRNPYWDGTSSVSEPADASNPGQ